MKCINCKLAFDSKHAVMYHNRSKHKGIQCFSTNQHYLNSLDTNFHDPRGLPTGRIQIGHESSFIYHLV